MSIPRIMDNSPSEIGKGKEGQEHVKKTMSISDILNNSPSRIEIEEQRQQGIKEKMSNSDILNKSNDNASPLSTIPPAQPVVQNPDFQEVTAAIGLLKLAKAAVVNESTSQTITAANTLLDLSEAPVVSEPTSQAIAAANTLLDLSVADRELAIARADRAATPEHENLTSRESYCRTPLDEAHTLARADREPWPPKSFLRIDISRSRQRLSETIIGASPSEQPESDEEEIPKKEPQKSKVKRTVSKKSRERGVRSRDSEGRFLKKGAKEKP
jgi:hypothetical protein